MDSSQYITKYKKNVYCINCGKEGHLSKSCNEAITSYGIILIDLDINGSIKEAIIKKTLDNMKSINIKNNNDIGIVIDDYKDIELFCHYKNYIKLLFIQRKHTLGFLEFIRGRYNIDNVDGIIFLFQQMTQEEIDKIKRLSFDELWNDVWGNKNKTLYHNEYYVSKEKFNKLKTKDDNELPLHFYTDNIKPTWGFAEWGFPKGRRNLKELDIECAIREFQEETNYNDEEFIILDNICPIEENFIGTNGINYRHIYYIAISLTKKKPTIDLSNQIQNNEIGAIDFFNYEEIMKLIRPYHTERQDIVTKVYIYLMNTIIKISKEISQKQI